MKRLFALLLLWSAAWGAAPDAHAQSPTPIPTASLSVADATTVEGNSGSHELLLPVTLSKAQSFDVSASYKTQNLTALANSDYTPQLAGQIVIKAGQTKANLVVRVVGNTFEEKDESFGVQLSAPKRCTLARSNATATIQDDDYAGRISIADTSITEGNSGQKAANLTVSLSPAPLHPLSVSYASADDSAKVSGSDYVATKGTLLFAPGRSALSVAVPIRGDTSYEANEKLLVRLSAPGYAIAKSVGNITIVNDDIQPPIAASIGNVSVAEVASLTETAGGVARLRVTIVRAPSIDTQINYTTRDGSAKAGRDYIATQGTLLFRAGTQTANLTVPLVDDQTEEVDESFSVEISSPRGITGQTSGVVTIRDNDYAGTVSVADARVIEGDISRTEYPLTVSLSSAPLHPLEFFYSQSGSTAKYGDDFIANSGRIIFATGQTTAMISSTIVGDTIEEADETFSVDFAPNLGTDGAIRVPGTVTILDDDYVVEASIASASVSEGKSGQTSASLTVSLSRETRRPLEFQYATSDGTAVAPGDYLATSGTLRFAPEQSTATISIPILGDTEIEANETIKVQLSGTSLSFPWTVTLTILNDDTVLAGLSGKIVFDSGRDGNDEIYAMNADGTAQTRLTNNAAADDAPAWSPDGQRIVFQSIRDGNLEIYAMNADGTGQIRLTDDAASDSNPAWSPDGQKIVFASKRGNGTSQLFQMNADGSDVKRVPDTTDISNAPAWSPDGGRIAFIDATRLGIMNADGTARSLFTLSAASATSTTASDPAFSPDGARIVYALYATRRPRNGSGGITRDILVHNYQIYVMNADGSGQTRLSQSGKPDLDPCFSPDGQFITFSSTRSGSTGIWAMRADGRGEVRLADGSNPSWASSSLAAAATPLVPQSPVVVPSSSAHAS